MPGLHLLADLHGCRRQPLLHDTAAMATWLRREATAAGLSIVGEVFHPFTDEATGEAAGVTGVLLLAESHVAVHTWPEREVVTLDVYVCNVRDDRSGGAERLLAALCEVFAPRRSNVRRVVRD